MLSVLDPADAGRHLASLRSTSSFRFTAVPELRPVRRRRHPLSYLARALSTGPGTLAAPTFAMPTPAFG